MKKDKKLTYDMLIGIATGIISALILSWVITPLSNCIFPKLLQIANKFSGTFVDFVYKKIAHITPESSISTNLLFTFITFTYVLWIIYYISIHIKHRFYDLSDETVYTLHENEAKEKGEESVNISLENKINNSKKIKQRAKRFHILLSLSLLFVFLNGCLSTMFQIYLSEVSSKALTRIEIAAPYISDQEYKQLKSNFYAIESKSDYDNLQRSLSNIFEENHLNLEE